MDIPGKEQGHTMENNLGKPRKTWSVALDVVPDSALFILLQYGIACFALSFWMHPLRLVTIVLEIGLIAKFLNVLEQLLPKRWIAFLVEAVCVGVVILLVWAVGYFPVSQTPLHLPWD